MAVEPDEGSSQTGDMEVALRVQELRLNHATTVREVSGRWADGLKALLGLAGSIGLIAAPIAAQRLSQTAQRVVGVLLLAVFVAGVVGLWLVMTAAYGSARTANAPKTLVDFELLRQSNVAKDRLLLLWGRRSASAALAFLAGAIGVAWIDPWNAGPKSVIVIATSTAEQLCWNHLGPIADGVVRGVATSGQPAEIPVADVRIISAAASCPET